MVHTDKGRKIFDEIKSDMYFVQTKPEDIIEGAKEMRESVSPNVHRQEFFEDASKLNGEQLFQKYFPDTLRVKMEHCVRLMCYKLGIYSIAKKMYVRITHKY